MFRLFKAAYQATPITDDYDIMPGLFPYRDIMKLKHMFVYKSFHPPSVNHFFLRSPDDDGQTNLLEIPEFSEAKSANGLK